MKSGVVIKSVDIKKLSKRLLELPGKDVLVGIPAEKTSRESAGLTNAQLGYIHEHGAPEVGIPARPFLIPGIKAANNEIAKYLGGAGRAVLKGDLVKAEQNLHAAGIAAVNSVQSGLVAGVPPPLADSTLRARARRKQGSGHRIGRGARFELAAREGGAAPSVIFAKPLIDTGQLLRAITYVVRARD